MSRNYFGQLFIAIDQLANVIFAGWADETISARAFRLGTRAEIVGKRDRWWYGWKIIDGLFFLQSGERCRDAYYAEQARLQIAPEYRPEDGASDW